MDHMHMGTDKIVGLPDLWSLSIGDSSEKNTDHKMRKGRWNTQYPILGIITIIIIIINLFLTNVYSSLFSKNKYFFNFLIVNNLYA